MSGLHDQDVERAVLGAAMLDPDALKTVCGRLAPDDFWYEGHRVLFDVLRQRADAGLPVGLAAINEAWPDHPQGHLVRGLDSHPAAYLARMLEAGSTELNVAARCDQLRHLADLRRGPAGQPGAQGAAGGTFRQTDLGNAERFTQRHGDRVRYCQATSTWLAWDGKRWAPDVDGQVRRLAVETVRHIYPEAATLDREAERKGLANHAMRSESQARVAAMLDLARSLKPIAAVPAIFDSPATDFLLNVENGTLDLRTGTLRPHRPEDFITKLAPVSFDPEARAEVWERFLTRMVPDPGVRAYLGRVVGYTLTGDTSEEALFFFHGPEAAGKSTATEAVKAVLGDYGRTADFESFLKKRGDAGVRDDIARLHGARMVLSLEVDEGRELAEGLVKNLTGGDTIAARHLYQSFFEFRPAFKLWLVANHRPGANAQDGALWRRIHLIPFTVSLPEAERDPAVKRALKEDPAVRSAILTWAVQGCLQWQRSRLQAPEGVRRATAAYRADCDHLAAFLSDCLDDGAQELTAREMRERYVRWCDDNGERPMAPRKVAEGLEAHGWTKDRRSKDRLWRRSMTSRRQMTPISVNLPHEGNTRKSYTNLASFGVRASQPSPVLEQGDLDLNAGTVPEKSDVTARDSHGEPADLDTLLEKHGWESVDGVK